MKLHGYCDVCHRFKRISVSSHGLVMAATSGVATGECDDCVDARVRRRTDRLSETKEK